MNVSNFANPQETVQIISIFSYLNILSDFLYSENLLEENDLFKKIPVINALYVYLTIHENDQDVKLNLVRKLLNGTDLYGENENETIDINFANIMFEHIISSFVFEEFGNIYGFLAEVVRSSDDITINNFLNNTRRYLKKLVFINDYKEFSLLTPLTVERIHLDLILPLFPIPEKNLNITSLDYIYALAGSIFCRSAERNFAYITTTNISAINNMNSSNIFNEYTGLAHVIENLFLAGKIEKFVMSIFSLPALFYYVYEDKESLKNVNMRNIIKDPNHWSKAYNTLFSHVNSQFDVIKNSHKNDYRHQLYLALATFKNRRVLAREEIKSICLNENKNDIEEKVTDYLRNAHDYKCIGREEYTKLPDLNKLFNNQINKVVNKYFQFEKESIREAFGNMFEAVTTKFIIAKGSFDNEEIRHSDDLLEFHFTGYRKSLFYALLRNDYNVTLISEADDPILFRKILGVSSSAQFAQNDFANLLKNFNQDFEYFLSHLATQKTEIFRGYLYSLDFGYKETEWWKEFGLSLIPFYSCTKNMVRGTIMDAVVACPIDTIQLFSVVGEVESIATKITTEATQFLYSEVGTTLKTVSLRESIQSAIGFGSISVRREMVHLPETVRKQLYNDFGHALIRLKDSGIELGFILKEEGLSSIKEVITKVESKISSFTSVKHVLENTKELLQSVPKVIGEKFGKEVHVKSLDRSGVSGYGYKFIYLPNGNIAQIRHVRESEDEILAVFDGVTENNEKIYKEVDIDTMKPNVNILHVENDGVLVKNPEPTPIEISLPLYKGGGCYRSRRSPDLNNYCLRTPILKEQVKSEEEAVEYALKFETYDKSEIQSKLRLYYFPPGKKVEMNLVHEWMGDGIYNLPAWINNYKIKEPELFHDLRFKKFLDIPDITEEEAVRRIEKIYSENELDQIGIVPEFIRSKYIKNEAYYSTTFEDYYAIGNQQGLRKSFGFLRIGENTDEGRRMRNALYRLAIRQMDNPVEEIPQKLFRGERRPKKVLDKLFASGKTDFEFGRFTSTSRNLQTATNFALGQIGQSKIMYEINFSGNYLSARVQEMYPNHQEETVLFPGSKFRIEKVSEETDEVIGDHLKVVLSYKHETMVEEVKSIMSELKKLKASGSQFYYNDPPKNRWPMISFKTCTGC